MHIKFALNKITKKNKINLLQIANIFILIEMMIIKFQAIK